MGKITVYRIRRTVQLLVLINLLAAAWQFSIFTDYLRHGDPLTMAPGRPAVAEGFLPIAAILAFKVMVATRQIDPVHPAGLFIFIATIITAWVFRRVLCSWICPIGFLSEQLSYVGRRLIGRNIQIPKWLDNGLLGFKYILFIGIIQLFFMMPTNEAISFMQSPFYAVSDIRMADMFLSITVIGVAIISFLLIGSIFIKSFWCRYLCPYGAFLGLLGLASPTTLHRTSETCTQCGKCSKNCPNGVNVQHSKNFVFSTECIGCGTCVEGCPSKDTLQFKLLGYIPVRPIIFGIAFILVFFGIIVFAKLTGYWETALTVDQLRYFDQILLQANPK